MEKICNICYQSKNITQFYKNKNRYDAYCRECRIEYSSKYNSSIKNKHHIKNQNELNEIIEFLDKIEKRKGYIDEIDVYRLTSYYITAYKNIIYSDHITQVELDYYYNKLLELKDVKIKNKLNKIVSKKPKYCCRCGDLITKGTTYCPPCRKQYNIEYKKRKENGKL